MKRKIIIFVLFTCAVFHSFAEDWNIERIFAFSDIYDFSVDSYLQSIGEEKADAIRLNTLGLNAYKQKNLIKAAKLWRCSVSRNENYSWANYNLACALALFAEVIGIDPADHQDDFEYMGDDDLLILYEYIDKVFFHLKKSIVLDNTLFSKMQKDRDLNIIRNMDKYKFMLFYPENDSKKVLGSAHTLRGSDTGMYPDGGSVTINGNQITLTIFSIKIENEQATDDFFFYDKTGTFSISGNKIIVQINSPKREILDGEIKLGIDEFGFVTHVGLIISGRYYCTKDPNIGGV